MADLYEIPSIRSVEEMKASALRDWAAATREVRTAAGRVAGCVEIEKMLAEWGKDLDVETKNSITRELADIEEQMLNLLQMDMTAEDLGAQEIEKYRSHLLALREKVIALKSGTTLLFLRRK